MFFSLVHDYCMISFGKKYGNSGIRNTGYLLGVKEIRLPHICLLSGTGGRCEIAMRVYNEMKVYGP